MVCQDVELHAGQVASANISAACRDPRRYTDPDTLDIGRTPGKQLYFGAGAHYCLGANLAKAGVAIAFETLGRRYPHLSLAGDDGDVRWDYEGFAGIVRLRVCA
jgi:cytochrome P450